MLTQQHPPVSQSVPRRVKTTRYQSEPAELSPATEAIDLGELSEEVRARIARRVQQLPLLGPDITDTSSDKEAGAVLT